MNLITGNAGFIGYHLSHHLLTNHQPVIGIDDLNDSYQPQLKRDRLAQLKKFPNFVFYKFNLTNQAKLTEIFKQHQISQVYHLAAYSQVRHSIAEPVPYYQENILSFLNLLEILRQQPKTIPLVYASTSAIYTPNNQLPHQETETLNQPLSNYAVSKQTTELMAHSYYANFNQPSVGLRFFTVYGPWGRPDMAIYLFSQALLKNQPILAFGQGKLKRDFTYVDDIVLGLESSANLKQGYHLINLGAGKNYSVLEIINQLASLYNKQPQIKLLPKPAADLEETLADLTKAQQLLNYQPQTNLKQGLSAFAKWFKEYYQINAQN